jgi:hypothetical protein
MYKFNTYEMWPCGSLLIPEELQLIRSGFSERRMQMDLTVKM